MANLNENKFAVEIHELQNFSEEQKVAVTKLCGVIGPLVCSGHFRSAVLEYSYEMRERKFFRVKTVRVNGFYESNGHTNEQIYQRLLSGKDMFSREEDNDLDLFWTLYQENSSTIGYTYPDTQRIWVNNKFFAGWLKNKQGRANLIGNILHEYMHKIGYTHSVHYTALRPHSVPYAIGYLATDIALKVFYRDL